MSESTAIQRARARSLASRLAFQRGAADAVEIYQLGVTLTVEEAEVTILALRAWAAEQPKGGDAA